MYLCGLSLPGSSNIMRSYYHLFPIHAQNECGYALCIRSLHFTFRSLCVTDLQMADNTISLWSIKAASRGGR